MLVIYFSHKKNERVINSKNIEIISNSNPSKKNLDFNIEPLFKNKGSITAKEIIKSNPTLKGKVKFRIQKDKNNIFKTVIKPKDKIDVTICNPPFHSSKKEAMRGSMRKVRNLTGKRSKKVKINFAGMANELICEGGEKQFISNMITESVNYAKKCLWFTTLVSKEENLKEIYKQLEKVKVTKAKTINMGTANKISRIVVWSFLDEKEHEEWKIS